MACKHKSRVWDNGWCNVACRYCTLTQETDCKHNKHTNADRIRAMSDEELAEFLFKTCPEDYFRTCTKFDSCNECWLDWLKQPAEVE